MTDVTIDSHTVVVALDGSDNFQPVVGIRSQGAEVRFIGSLDDLELMANEILRSVDVVRHPRPAVHRGYEPCWTGD